MLSHIHHPVMPATSRDELAYANEPPWTVAPQTEFVSLRSILNDDMRFQWSWVTGSWCIELIERFHACVNLLATMLLKQPENLGSNFPCCSDFVACLMQGFFFLIQALCVKDAHSSTYVIRECWDHDSRLCLECFGWTSQQKLHVGRIHFNLATNCHTDAL